MKKFKEIHGEGKLKKNDNTKVVITKETIIEIDKEARIRELNQIKLDAQNSIVYSQSIIDGVDAELAMYE